MTAALEGAEWSAARPGRTLPPGKTRYPFYRRLGGTQGRSGRAENLVPTGNSIPDRPARSQSLYRLSYRAVTLCGLANIYRPFGRAYRLRRQRLTLPELYEDAPACDSSPTASSPVEVPSA